MLNLLGMTMNIKNELISILLQSKCYPYWDDKNDVSFGDYTIRCNTQKHSGEWVERTLTATDKLVK